VLAKPYTGGAWDDTTASEHRLPGTFRALQADGTLGEPVDMVSLRSGEGAILLRE